MLRLWKLVRWPLAIYLGIFLLFAWLESTILYPAPTASIGDWQAEWLDHEDVEFRSSDGTALHGWFCGHPSPRVTILVCHGNGECVADMAQELEFLRQQFAANVFAFDYRGYGKSEGWPVEEGLLQDGEAAQAWLAQRVGQRPEEIVVIGRSLGGGIAVHLAAQNGVRGLVLDRTFSSMVDCAAHHFPWLPVRLALRNRYPSQERILEYHGPLLQLHGKADRVVPWRFGKALFDAAPSNDKEFVSVDDLGHNDPWPRAFVSKLMRFLQRI